jgi:accessory gene regulator protein AgrB
MTNTNKVISSVILLACFPIMAILPTHPASLLFIFVSGNKWVSAVRLAVALIMFALSFGFIRPRQNAQRLWLGSGLGLIGFGVFALLITSLGSFLYDYIKIMDVMIITEAGIIVCSMALTHPTVKAAAPVKAKNRRRPKAKVATA